LDSKRKYDVVHVHSLPDFLVFVAIIQKLKGRNIILDLHEVMPEIFAARFKKDMGSSAVKIVYLLEKVSTAFAHHVITVNNVRKEVIVERGVLPDKVTVIMNTPDEKIFIKKKLKDFKIKHALDGKFITVYVGGINPERNIEVIIKAIAKIKSDVPEVFFMLFGHTYGLEGDRYKSELNTLANNLGVGDRLYIGGELKGEEVASYLDLAHFGIISYVKNPMTELAMPNKVFEYIALGKPIIACRLKGLYALLGDYAAVYYEAESENDLAEKIKYIYENDVEREKMVDNAKEVYKKHTWGVMKKRLLSLYDDV
jgi:glycosyltransferase involved in cell wall biosynthesis